MSASDVLAVVAATLVAILTGALVFMLVNTARTLRELRATVELLREDALALLDDAYAAVRDATYEVERVDALVTSAEKLNGAVDGAQRIARRVRQRREGRLAIGRAKRQSLQWRRRRVPLWHSSTGWLPQPLRQRRAQRQQPGLGIHRHRRLALCKSRLQPKPRAQHRALEIHGLHLPARRNHALRQHAKRCP